jgi:hypothetical protein
MHKNITKCNETLSKWCKNKHGASKIIDTLETYHGQVQVTPQALESTRRRIVHVCGQLWHVVGVESEAETSGAEICVERPVGARTRTPRKPDEPRRGATASQRGAPEKWRVEVSVAVDRHTQTFYRECESALKV